MADKIIGTFVFRDMGDGCLSCKWLNNGNDSSAYAEAAKLKPNQSPSAAYIGEYTTIWIYDEEVSTATSLTIEKPAHSDRYILTWKKNSKYFNGIGMLYDGLLVGAYWNVEVANFLK